MQPPEGVTELLVKWSSGDQKALDKLMPLVYGELGRLATNHLRRERQNHTLQPTALVNEAYLKLIDQKNARWQNRAQFFGVSAHLMRRIVKVLDFGLAKLAQTQSRSGPEDSTRALVKTNTGVVMGTVAYMSPEQARGLSLDARTDIWSLGVVIYQMLTGSSPFSGATSSDTLVSILERDPRSLKSFSGEIPEELEWIVTKALTKDFDDRYQTSREMLNDLRRLKQRLSVAAELERSLAPQLSERADAARATSLDATVVDSSRPKSKRWLVGATLLVAMIALVSAIIWKGGAYWFNHAAQTPVVVLMDSPLPDRVYDPETRKNGGTNADDINRHTMSVSGIRRRNF